MQMTDPEYPRLYAVWAVMKQRCFNQKSQQWKHYGARGITVCDNWRQPNGYHAFRKWAIEAGYRIGLTIDRYPNKDGNYEPSNCRWVTRAENLRNRRMTPAWIAAIAKMLAAPVRHDTEAQKAASRINMAKARSVAFTLPHSKAQIEAAKANLVKALEAKRLKRSRMPQDASDDLDHHITAPRHA